MIKDISTIQKEQYILFRNKSLKKSNNSKKF